MTAGSDQPKRNTRETAEITCITRRGPSAAGPQNRSKRISSTSRMTKAEPKSTIHIQSATLASWVQPIETFST
ncbi:hypothetical protein D3C72_2502420 [compost metagenome]